MFQRRSLHAALTATLLLDENSEYLHARNAGRIGLRALPSIAGAQVGTGRPTRILIADDVGVGKTIEACLYPEGAAGKGAGDSVLVVCPKPLVVDEKWRTELMRFEEDFVHLDSKTLRWCLEGDRREGDGHRDTARRSCRTPSWTRRS